MEQSTTIAAEVDLATDGNRRRAMIRGGLRLVILAALAAFGTAALAVPCPSMSIDKQVSCDAGLNWSDSCLGLDNPNDPNNPYQPEVTVRYLVTTSGAGILDNCELTDSNGQILAGPIAIGTIGENVTDQLIHQTDLLTCDVDLELNEPNTATLVCECILIDDPVATFATDTAEIECRMPALEIDKICDWQNVETDLNTVQITVTNPDGPRRAGLVNCSVQERLIVPGPDIPVPFNSGLFDLAPGESIAFDFDLNMPVLGVTADGLNAASVICQIAEAPGKTFVAGDQDVCETCTARVDKQVSCDAGATWEDGCTGRDEPGVPSIQVRYLADVPGGDLFNCVLTDSNGEILPVPVDVGPLPGDSSGTPIFETELLTCSDTLVAGEPNTATLTCECYEEGSGEIRTVQDVGAIACTRCGDGVIDSAYGETCDPPDEPVAGGNLVLDPGFEAGTPNPFWSEFSTNFGTPICDLAFCGSDLAADGSWWAWFGGTSAAEESIVAQPIDLPDGASATLSFQLWLATCSAETSDFFEVNVNEDTVFMVDLTDARCGNGDYGLETVDLSAYLGQSITLEFRSVTGTTGASGHIFLDVVSLEVFDEIICRADCTCPDFDADDVCDAFDADDDNDGVDDESDPNSFDPDQCGDSDRDTCDDCSVGTDDFGPLSDQLPNNDGPDDDGDGLCDAGDGIAFTTYTTHAIVGQNLFREAAYRIAPESTTVDLFASGFLSMAVNMVALDVKANGNVLFAVEAPVTVPNANKTIRLFPGVIYSWNGTKIRVKLRPWSSGVTLSTLNALDQVGGDYYFSVDATKTLRVDGVRYRLYPSQLWRLDPDGDPKLELVRNFSGFGFDNVDGVDLLPDGRIAISAKENGPGYGVFHEDVYVWDPATDSVGLSYRLSSLGVADSAGLTLIAGE